MRLHLEFLKISKITFSNYVLGLLSILSIVSCLPSAPYFFHYCYCLLLFKKRLWKNYIVSCLPSAPYCFHCILSSFCSLLFPLYLVFLLLPIVSIVSCLPSAPNCFHCFLSSFCSLLYPLFLSSYCSLLRHTLVTH